MDLSGYPDQAGDSFVEGCSTLAELGWTKIFLRSYNGRPILGCSDQECQTALEVLSASGLSVAGLITDAGYERPRDLRRELDRVRRAKLLGNYFGAKYVRIWSAQFTRVNSRDWPPLLSFLDEATQILSDAGLQPLFEPCSKSVFGIKPVLQSALNQRPDLRFIYDPVALCLGRVPDVMAMWSMIAEKTLVIEIRDMLRYVGMCLPGDGEMRWGECFQVENPAQFLVFDPGLGYRYKGVVGKSETFRLAVSRFLSCFPNVAGGSHGI